MLISTLSDSEMSGSFSSEAFFSSEDSGGWLGGLGVGEEEEEEEEEEERGVGEVVV